MYKKIVSLLLVFAMVLSLLPMGVFASQSDEAEPTVYAQSPYTPGPKGDEDVAVMVYGKSISEAVHKTGYSFMDFVNALKSELQGILANEKIPDTEMYLVSDKGYEYALTKNAVKDAAFLSSFRYDADGILGWTDYVVDFIQLVFGWLVRDIDTIGEFYRIYGATDVPEGDYTLEIRKINGEGYTLWQPESGQVRVHVGDDHVNYVGYDQMLGKYDLNFKLDLGLIEIDWDVLTVEFSMPGVFYNTVEPGFTFKSADFGRNGIEGTEFVLVNRDETEKIVKAALAMGKDTFTNAMNLIGTEGFTWDELNALDKELLVWDNEAQQITFDKERTLKLLGTYWALVEASGKQPLKDFLSDETDIRLPAILCAESDADGNVHFTEDSNVTLIWSLQILLKMGNIVLTEAQDMNFTEGVFENPRTEAIVNLVIAIAKYAAELGTEVWDENGELVNGIVNDWIYPVLQNDNVPGYAKDILFRFLNEDEMSDEMKEMLDLLPTHAILTPKLPAGHYIMLETDVPDGYIRSPLFYTMNLEWRTESADIRDWCYVTVGNIGVILPYYAEDYFTYLREFSGAAAADSILAKLSGKDDVTILEDTLNGTADITALTIAYNAELIYRYMGGDKLYASQEELAKALSEYLYTYGRTAQNLMMFAGKVVRESKSVITSEINSDWIFYNYSTSLRTNLALTTKAIIKGIADSIDTSGSSGLGTAAKDALNNAADSIDTSNRIIVQTTQIQNKVEEKVNTAVSRIGQSILQTTLKTAKSILKWSMK